MNSEAKSESVAKRPLKRLVRAHQDRDIQILAACAKALDRSTSPRMLRANLEFLVGHYLRPNEKAEPLPPDSERGRH